MFQGSLYYQPKLHALLSGNPSIYPPKSPNQDMIHATRIPDPTILAGQPTPVTYHPPPPRNKGLIRP